MVIQNLSSNCFGSAVNTRTAMNYATDIQKAQDSKEKTEDSIFKLQNVSYKSNVDSSNKNNTSETKEVKTNSADTSSTLSLLQSLVSSLTTLIDKLTNAQNDFEKEDSKAEEADKTNEADDEAELTTASKANDNNQKTQTDEEKSLKVESKSELLKKLEHDGLDSSLLRPEDLEEIFAYDVQYKDGKIVCTDVNGEIRKIVSIGEGQYTYDRVGDSNQMRCNGRISHSFGYGKWYQAKMMPKNWFLDDLTYYFTYITDHYKEVLKERGFSLSC